MSQQTPRIVEKNGIFYIVEYRVNEPDIYEPVQSFSDKGEAETRLAYLLGQWQ